LLSDQGMRPAEFERAVTYAKSHDWLMVSDGTLTLTQLGYEIGSASRYTLSHPSGAMENS